MSELTTYQMSSKDAVPFKYNMMMKDVRIMLCACRLAIIQAGVKTWRGSKRLSEVKRSKAETGLMYRSINLWRAGVTVITVRIDKVEGCTTV